MPVPSDDGRVVRTPSSYSAVARRQRIVASGGPGVLLAQVL